MGLVCNSLLFLSIFQRWGKGSDRSTLGTSPQDTSRRLKEKVVEDWTNEDTCLDLLGVDFVLRSEQLMASPEIKGSRGETSANEPQQQQYLPGQYAKQGKASRAAHVRCCMDL